MIAPVGLTDEERADDDREPFRNRREELAWNNGYAAGLAAAQVPREPTQKMMNAADPINNFESMNLNVWRAMHDAATGETK